MGAATGNDLLEMLLTSVSLAVAAVPEGQFLRGGGETVTLAADPHLQLLLAAGALCNDARLQEEEGRWLVVGDTTEGALRVLTIAYRPLERLLPEEEMEREIVFLGLVAIQDPPRPEVREAVAVCHQAGIVSVMITGDHAATALAIAWDLNMVEPQGAVLTGADLDRLGDDEMRQAVGRVRV